MLSTKTPESHLATGATTPLLSSASNTLGLLPKKSRMQTSAPADSVSIPRHVEPAVLHHSDWSSGHNHWNGVLEGGDVGTDVTVLFYTTDQTGAGPRLHVHPYDEVFIVRRGRAMFTIGDRKIAAQAGDILVGPANVPHKFHNLGPGVLETTDVHVSKQWIQTNL